MHAQQKRQKTYSAHPTPSPKSTWVVPAYLENRVREPTELAGVGLPGCGVVTRTTRPWV